MRTFPSLRFLVRSLTSDPSQRRILLATVLSLFKKRRVMVNIISPFIDVLPDFGSRKLILWRSIAAAIKRNKYQFKS